MMRKWSFKTWCNSGYLYESILFFGKEICRYRTGVWRKGQLMYAENVVDCHRGIEIPLKKAKKI